MAVGDICNNAFTIHKDERRLRYYNFIEASGFPPAVAAVRFKEPATFAMICGLWTQQRHRTSAPYSVSPELFRRINAFPPTGFSVFTTGETSAEDELFETGAGDLTRAWW